MPRISGAQRGEGVQAVVFALQVLEYLAHHRASVGVTDLARVFDTTKSRMHRHLQTLVAAGYVVREAETERYRGGTRLIAFGHAVSGSFALTSAARPVMENLRAALGHAVTVSQPEPEGVRVIAALAGNSALEIGVQPGSMLAAHSTAHGKLSLAYGGEIVLERVLAQPLVRSTPQTVTDRNALRSEVAQVKRQGWATAPNQTIVGLNALAAPIFGASGIFVGAVAIVDRVQFIPESPSIKQIESIVDAGKQISASIGYRGA